MKKTNDFLFLMILLLSLSCKDPDQGANYLNSHGILPVDEIREKEKIAKANYNRNDDEKNEGEINLYDDYDPITAANRDIQRMTKDFSNVPSSEDVNSHLDDILSSPGPCHELDLEKTPQMSYSRDNHPLAVGARRVLASFYQSCKAIDIPIDYRTPVLKGIVKGKVIDGEKGAHKGNLRKVIDKDALVKSHIILSELKKDSTYPGPQCRDATLNPPVYGYGSRATPDSNGHVKIFKKGKGLSSTSQSASGIDCSAFIDLCFGAQGLKLGKKSRPYLTTRSLGEQIYRPDSCLRSSTATPQDIIRPGDIINVAGSHAVIIDRAGEDPLGVEKHAKNGKCRDIGPKDFNFSYIHSGSIRGSYGPSRVMANIHRRGVMWDNLKNIAVEMCFRKVNNEKEHVNVNKIEGIPGRFSMIRHNSKDKDCVADDKFTIEGEECINHCSNLKGP